MHNTLDDLFMLFWAGLFWMAVYLFVEWAIKDYKNKDWKKFRDTVQGVVIFLILFLWCIQQVWLMFIISCIVIAIIVGYAALIEREREKSTLPIKISGLIFIGILLLAMWLSNRPITLYSGTTSTVYVVDKSF